MERRERPQEKGEWGEFALLLGRHWRKLFYVQLLVALSALGVVTLPAGIAAGNRVYIKLLRDQNALVWPEWKAGFSGSLREGVPLGAGYFLLLLLGLELTRFSLLPLRCLGLLLAFGALVWGSAGFFLLAVQDLSWGKLWKNSLLLLAAEPKTALGLGLLWALGLGFLGVFFPCSLLVLPTGLAGLVQFVSCRLLWGPVEKHMVAPWERGKK